MVLAIDSSAMDLCPCVVEAAKKKEETQIEIITKVTRVALLVLALYVQFQVAAIAFSIGMAFGAVMKFKHIVFEKGTLSPLCITGYLEFCTGSRFPAIVRTGFTAIFLTDCIMRGSPLFVALITAGVGYSAGYGAADFFKLKDSPVAAVAA